LQRGVSSFQYLAPKRLSKVEIVASTAQAVPYVAAAFVLLTSTQFFIQFAIAEFVISLDDTHSEELSMPFNHCSFNPYVAATVSLDG
jgi:hypothetical protein